MHSSREIKYYRIRLISQEMQRNAYNHVIRKSYPQHYLTAIFTISEHYICQKRAIRLFFLFWLGKQYFHKSLFDANLIVSVALKCTGFCKDSSICDLREPVWLQNSTILFTPCNNSKKEYLNGKLVLIGPVFNIETFTNEREMSF